ncbi:hypothetical protein QTO19_00230 [Serratia marcescens]|uniref:NACHT C-terminal Alpha/Beta 2 domain-containing protein n=1 Tax=Rouxiella silvae TaxID=1646373 RepID=A0AA41BY40_9GAMM|nr:hypothetical protein [Rouxiella silvae]MBF6638757.1 hypothetical protein [Rouxiella silvae]
MAKNNRDDFSERTKLQIAKRVGWLCSFPMCRKWTVGATSDGESEINIGTAAHICAAAPGGPRYDGNMSPEERSSAKNGMWMCRDHGKAIDSSDPEFTVEKLLKWKREAEIEAWKRVLHSDVVRGTGGCADTEVVMRARVAAVNDLEVFRRTHKWPGSSVALMLDIQGLDEPVITSAIAGMAIRLDDLILVAGPGMGKTTTLFQIAESMLATNLGTPLVVSLGDWATENTTILDSILKRPAFRDVSEDDLRKVANHPGVVLLLDGWNELDASARTRARTQITRLKAELPELSFIISTRKQSRDIPFEGTHVTLLPLNQDQQIQIAVALRGNYGKRILDQAWRTAGLRELVTIPLYLMALTSLPENAPVPTTKEQILRHFVEAHEKEASHAEALYSGTYGFQQDYMKGLAEVATRLVNSTIVDFSARKSISDTATLLVDSGQIAIKPQPEIVLDVLVSNHVLMRTGNTPGYSFQHQQFQEWYASHLVERRLIADINARETREALKAEVFNYPRWEEAILFAIERMAYSDAKQQVICSKAIIAAFEVDPILAAEMIFRSTDDVWSQISTVIQNLVAHWHVPGTVDRAVRFMITSGRPEFLDYVWPLISDEDEQISLHALRNCRIFRTSIFGEVAGEIINTLSPRMRSLLLSEIASRSGIDGLDLAVSIAKNDPDSQVQVSVIDALVFRRADLHVAEMLREVNSTILDLIVSKGVADEIQDENVREILATAHKRQEMQAVSPSNRLRALIATENTEDDYAELVGIISTMEIESNEEQLIDKLHRSYPQTVAEGLLERVRAGRSLCTSVGAILASARFTLEDEMLVNLVLVNPEDYDARANAAASVLGPGAVGHLIDVLADLELCNQAEGKYEEAKWKRYQGLRTRIGSAQGSSLVDAILKRAVPAEDRLIELFTDLLLSHPNGEESYSRSFDADTILVIQRLFEEWANRMLASKKAKRRVKARVAMLASLAPSVKQLPLLKQLLDDNLQRYREFRKEAETAGWRPCEAVNEARTPMLNEYQSAFQAIQSPETTAIMQTYLCDKYFGALAARVLAEQWRTLNAPSSGKRFLSGVDFSNVKAKHMALTHSPDETSLEAEAIFNAIDQLITQDATSEQKQLAVELGIIASQLPHGRRDDVIKTLIAVAPRQIRADLLTSIVLSGDGIDTKVVVESTVELIEAAIAEPWILSEGQGYQLKAWLRLLPFMKEPEEALSVIRSLPASYRDPYFLEEMVRGFCHSPSPYAEDALFKLAEENTSLYANYHWRTTALRLETLSSVRRIIDLTAQGVFESRSSDNWHFEKILGNLLEIHSGLRAYIYGLLIDGPISPGLEALTRIIAQSPDEEGVLLLLNFERSLNRRFMDWRTINKMITQDIPSETWQGTFEIVPVPAGSLRMKLFELVTDGGPDDVAAYWMRKIDCSRDEYGTPEDEPRHPDIASGRPWPVSLALLDV